jgi:translation elongation factor EF-1alpha
MKSAVRCSSQIQWVQYASYLHKRITEKQQDISKHFPNKEYLHPIDNLDEPFKKKLNKLLSINIDDFVSISNIETLLTDAQNCKIERGNILYIH